MASQPIYQFYSELADYKPKIWRRFQVLGNVTMARFGYILMTLYEMQASHLFSLTVPIRENVRLMKGMSDADLSYMDEFWRFEIPTIDLPPNKDELVSDATECKLRSILRGVPGEKLAFLYDFGDNWEVNVTLEAILEDKELSGRELPRVLEGKGYGIIEDCGGPWGLKQIAKAFRKKSGEDYETYRDWLGRDDIDLTAFDLADMNLRLKKVPRIYTDLYEYQLEPTKRSLDFLARKYKA